MRQLSWAVFFVIIYVGVHNLGSMVMIGTVIGASVLGCMGFKLERLLGFLRMALVAGVITLASLAYTYHGQIFSEVLLYGTGVKELVKLLFKTKLIWTIIWLVFVATTTFFLQLTFPRSGNSLSTFLLFALASATICSMSKITLPDAVVVTLMTCIGLAALFLRLWRRELYSIWTTAVTGGVVVALLFTKFYYLPLWLFVLLAVAFSASGFSIQRSSWKKSVQTGDEK